jgi:hypothetical protein
MPDSSSLRIVADTNVVFEQQQLSFQLFIFIKIKPRLFLGFGAAPSNSLNMIGNISKNLGSNW